MNALKVALLIGISILIYSFDFAGKKDIYPGYVIFNNDHREEGKIQPGSLTAGATFSLRGPLLDPSQIINVLTNIILFFRNNMFKMFFLLIE